MSEPEVEGSTLRETNFCDFRDPLRDCGINFIPLQRPDLTLRNGTGMYAGSYPLSLSLSIAYLQCQQ